MYSYKILCGITLKAIRKVANTSRIRGGYFYKLITAYRYKKGLKDVQNLVDSLDSNGFYTRNNCFYRMSPKIELLITTSGPSWWTLPYNRAICEWVSNNQDPRVVNFV